MLEICAELRPLAQSKSLLTCADGTQLILQADAVCIAELLDSARTQCTQHVLGSPLYSVLAQHGSLRELPAASKERELNEPDSSRSATVVVCGDELLGQVLVTALTRKGLSCSYSHRGPRECSYEVFRGGFLIVCRSSESRVQFDDELRALSELNVSWIPVDYCGCSLRVGPAVIEGRGATYSDCLARERANAVNDEVFTASLQPALRGNFLRVITSTPLLVEECATLLRRICSGMQVDQAQSSVLDTVWEMRPNSDLVIHSVLPRSFINPPDKNLPIHPPTFLVDRLYGIVRELTTVAHSPMMPPTLATTQARTTDLSKMSGYINTVFCQGSSIIPSNTAQDDIDRIRKKNFYAAIGESAERYCSNLIDLKPVHYASYNELTRRGFPALDPRELVLFSSRQYETAGFPFQPLTTDLRIGWVEGRYLDDDSAVYVPASLVYVNWYLRQNRHQPRINFPAFAGVAAGMSTEQAILSGLSEIIERHATMVWWLNKHALPHIKLTQSQLALFDGAQEALRPALIHVDNTFNIPVAAGVVHNDISTLVHIGFSCRSTLAEAALKAWSEALTLQEGAHDLKNPDGIHWSAIRDGLLPGRSYKAWREDRCYLDDFRPDLKDVDDLLVQQEVFLDPRAVEHVAPLLDRVPTREPSTVNELPNDRLSTYMEKVYGHGNRIIVVDITSPDVASCGLTVIRTLVPGTVGNTPAAFPYLGNGVVVQEAVKLGWRDRPLAEEDVNNFPMPHA